MNIPITITKIDGQEIVLFLNNFSEIDGPDNEGISRIHYIAPGGITYNHLCRGTPSEIKGLICQQVAQWEFNLRNKITDVEDFATIEALNKLNRELNKDHSNKDTH